MVLQKVSSAAVPTGKAVPPAWSISSQNRSRLLFKDEEGVSLVIKADDMGWSIGAVQSRFAKGDFRGYAALHRLLSLRP